ncbi:hydroxyethylthiazole kinase-like uncharacterized protein yjeF/hydroxyethylthiazole kinase-like uncharacterized protein yjeF [Rhizobium azibense]|uniref:Bifunctional NAD(P)H-hydrate repair enzyme n=1 Tax=Rhizobium azibense TaxID=1136135 RepID=A0A4R3QFZ6_9HYPH|nr:NAD(P)H-hydrate dehydratase [Rhizobium azibense]TCU20653.1 hydroxyethylthiazole kinase-like uncharacterized protein yjeF/hydroxyethylthiazole kinase-like uncharacterized protein yjeF [Rhizobium azibense]
MAEKLGDLLLTPAEMAAVDAAAAASGIASFGLMWSAGAAVAGAALRLYPGALRFAVLCGPGNNGGDGYVAARRLVESGAEVAVFHFGDPARLHGDAARARAECALASQPLNVYVSRPGDVVVDAIFGAGLGRDVPLQVRSVIEKVTDAAVPVISVDLPSGLDGRSGEVLGTAFKAAHTVTFMTRKPGHLLMPGRELCGRVEVTDIGIPGRIIKFCSSGMIAENTPEKWAHLLAPAKLETHKYKRGHLAVFSGGAGRTGAARMSAMAGLKAGAGLVTIATPGDAMAENSAHLTAVMLHVVDDAMALRDWLADKRLQTFVLGPGFGIGARTRDFIAALKDRHLVLDADAITSFKEDPRELFKLFAEDEPHVVLTPHEGEFARLFPDIAADKRLSKVEKAQASAQRANAAIVYKGADTVIASPDGRVLINTNAPVWLATAGSGDVLSGMIGALLAQGLPAFEAAACGVYLHGEAGQRVGKGLTAEDLVAHVRPL